jgi:hypothetical protein
LAIPEKMRHRARHCVGEVLLRVVAMKRNCGEREETRALWLAPAPFLRYQQVSWHSEVWFRQFLVSDGTCPVTRLHVQVVSCRLMGFHAH